MTKKQAAATAVAQRYTVYEKARLVGARALQISQGAPFFVKLSDEELAAMKYNPIEIAKREFAEGRIPIDVKRKTPE
jgi:DNA-directed RNA polymerase subunit K